MKTLIAVAFLALLAIGCRPAKAQAVIAPGGSVTVSCTPGTTPTPPAACTYTYSDWSACSAQGTQSRTVLSSAPPGCVGTPVLTQACTPAPPGTCTPDRHIPWAQWYAEGCDWYCVQTQKGLYGITDCEKEQAYAVGYPRPPTPDSGGGSGGGGGNPVKCPSTESSTMSWEAAANNNGCLYYVWGGGGCKSFTVPAGYSGMVTLENVINTNSTHISSTATINGQMPSTISGQGGISHQVSLAPGSYSYCVSLATPGGATVTMRHYP